MKFISLCDKQSIKNDLDNDFKSADKYGKVRLSASCLYISKLFSNYFISFSDIAYCFRRVMIIPAKKRQLQVENVVIVDKDMKELAVVQLPGRKITQDFFNNFKAKDTAISFCCPDELKSKYSDAADA